METGTGIEPKLQTGCAQPYVAIPVQVFDEGNKLDVAIDELTDWLNQNGIKIAGPLFYRYHTSSNLSKPLSIEVGYPVATQVGGQVPIITGNIPEGTFATIVHCGHPGVITGSIETLQCWASHQGIQWKYSVQSGIQIWAGCFEFYLTNPADVADKSHCRTAIALLTNR